MYDNKAGQSQADTNAFRSTARKNKTRMPCREVVRQNALMGIAFERAETCSRLSRDANGVFGLLLNAVIREKVPGGLSLVCVDHVAFGNVFDFMAL